jgi:TolB protein
MVPAISPDGRRLAFSTVYSSSSLDKVGTISIVDLPSGGQVTIRSEDAAGLRWSPDSSTLAFTEFMCEERLPCTRIETISADGARRRTVFDDPTRTTSFPEWTPDGSHLRFGTMDAEGSASPVTLHEAAADGSGSVVLGTLLTGAGVLSPSWSPDGTRLAWLENGGRTEAESFVELWVSSADGQNATRLVASGHGNVGGSGPIWSPDGQLLAFGYTFGGNPPGDTYVIGADGTGLHKVASVEGPLAWLPATSGPLSPP